MMKDQMTVQSGDRAPDFVVPAVHEDRTISLADYRGRTPVLLGLFRGLYCPFCRRAMAQMASTSVNRTVACAASMVCCSAV